MEKIKFIWSRMHPDERELIVAGVFAVACVVLAVLVAAIARAGGL